MAMMSKAEAERLILEYERRQALLNGMLARQEVDPWVFKRMARVLDEAIEGVKKDLAITRLTLDNRSQMERSRWYAWVIGVDPEELKKGLIRVTRKQGPLLKHQSPRFRLSDFAELDELRNRGVKLIPASFPPRTDKPKKVVEARRTDGWVSLTPEAGRRFMALGAAVLWNWVEEKQTAQVKQTVFELYWPEDVSMRALP